MKRARDDDKEPPYGSHPPNDYDLEVGLEELAHYAAEEQRQDLERPGRLRHRGPLRQERREFKREQHEYDMEMQQLKQPFMGTQEGPMEIEIWAPEPMREDDWEEHNPQWTEENPMYYWENVWPYGGGARQIDIYGEEEEEFDEDLDNPYYGDHPYRRYN